MIKMKTKFRIRRDRRKSQLWLKTKNIKIKMQINKNSRLWNQLMTIKMVSILIAKYIK